MNPTNSETTCSCASCRPPESLVDLNHIFATRFRASLNRTPSGSAIKFILESKSCEIMAAFKEMQESTKAHPEATADMNEIIAENIYFLLAVITANLDLPLVAQHIKPCGIPQCSCHDAKLMVIRSLQMIKDGMKAQSDRVSSH